MEEFATQDILQGESLAQLQEFALQEDALMETINVIGLSLQ